jgi:hypothetical protein
METYKKKNFQHEPFNIFDKKRHNKQNNEARHYDKLGKKQEFYAVVFYQFIIR